MASATKTPQIQILTKSIANYMKTKLRTVLVNPALHVPFPDGWSLDLLIDCDLAVQKVAQAYKSRVSTKWDIEEYVSFLTIRDDGRNQEREAELSTRFPPIHLPAQRFHGPLLVTDEVGHALAWILPEVISPTRQTDMCMLLLSIESAFRVQNTSTNWRVSGAHYKNARQGGMKPGTISLSPAWFEQGHDTDAHPLKVSTTLVETDGLGNRWVAGMMEHSALLGGILSLIHPEQYKAGLEAMGKLASHPEMVDRPDRIQEILEIWTAPFHGLSIISNRRTPVHRDTKGCREWMDMLVTLGDYEGGILDLPGLGIQSVYGSGTVAAVAGRVISHAADANGERACIAYYMREKVHQRLRTSGQSWFIPDTEYKAYCN